MMLITLLSLKIELIPLHLVDDFIQVKTKQVGMFDSYQPASMDRIII